MNYRYKDKNVLKLMIMIHNINRDKELYSLEVNNILAHKKDKNISEIYEDLLFICDYDKFLKYALNKSKVIKEVKNNDEKTTLNIDTFKYNKEHCSYIVYLIEDNFKGLI